MTDSASRSEDRASTSKAGLNIRPRFAAAAVAGFLVIVMVLSALVFLPSASAPEIEMTVMEDAVREISYGQSAVYNIDVQNTGDRGTGLLHLELTKVPDSWDAELSHDSLSLGANSHRIVSLTVIAPTVEAAAAAECNGGLDRVAAIGVRGGNVTVGTTTVLTGTVSLTREGATIIIDPTQGTYEVKSGDTLEAAGYAMLQVDLSKLFYGVGDYSGIIFLGLHNATVGILRDGDTAFLWVRSGHVAVLGPERGAGGSGVRGDPQSNWMLNIGHVLELDSIMPGLEYNAVLMFDPDVDNAFLSLEVNEPNRASASVYEGNLLVGNQLGFVFVTEMETVSGRATQLLPLPQPVQATIVEMDGGGSTEEIVTIDDRNVYDRNDTLILIDAGGIDHYIIPTEGQGVPDVKVAHLGRIEGTYRTRATVLGDYTVRAFEFHSTSTMVTVDTLTFKEDMIVVDCNEAGKTYDLIITYRGRGESEEVFQVHDIRTSKDIQNFEVTDWERLTDTEGSVLFTEGGVTVDVENGEDGESLLEKMEDQGGGHGTGDEGDWITGYLWYWVGGSVLVLVLFIFMGATAASSRKQRERGGKEGELMQQTLRLPGMESRESPGVEPWRLRDTRPGYPPETKPLETVPGPGPGEYAERGPSTAGRPDTPGMPGMGGYAGRGPEPKKTADTVFPKRVECYNCGLNYHIEVPGTFVCSRCGTLFKVDEMGYWLKPADK